MESIYPDAMAMILFRMDLRWLCKIRNLEMGLKYCLRYFAVSEVIVATEKEQIHSGH